MDYEKLKAAGIKGGLKEHEIDAFLKQPEMMAKVPIWSYLRYVVEQEIPLESTDDSTPERKKALANREMLLAQISDKTGRDDKTARNEITFHGGIRLCIQVGIAPKNHSLDIRLPPVEQKKQLEMSKQILAQIDKLAELVGVYYRSLMAENDTFFKMLTVTLPHINFAELGINKFNRTMCFSESHAQRLAIIVYYVDKENRLITD